MDNDFSAGPSCELGQVFGDICRRILYLRQRRGVVALVMLCCIDVKDTFHQIPVDPLHAAKFSYVFDEYAVVVPAIWVAYQPWLLRPCNLVVGACPQPDELPRYGGFWTR